jgi:uncharacterized protein (DUF362 family)
MKRRTFLRDLAVGGLAFHVAPSLFSHARTPQAAQADLDMVLVEGESAAAITTQAIASLGGMERFVTRGDVVMVKPNIGWDRTPEQAACTNPDVVKVLVELCFDAGAKKVLVIDNPCNQAKRTYVRSGISEAAKNAGAKVLFPNPHKLKKMALGGEWLKEWEVYTDFVEVDKMINVPIAKNHSLSRLSLGMKNWLGALGGNRNQLHQKLDQAMIDLAAFFKPQLTVLDAYRVLVRNGPQGGRLSDVEIQKMVVAGIDYVGVDAVGTTFFGMKPDDLPYLRMAHQKGHGQIEIKGILTKKINR